MHLKDLALDHINYFDIAILALALLGFIRGRKHGISVELVPLAKWLCVLVVGRLLGPIVGGWLAYFKLSSNQQLQYGYSIVIFTNLLIFFLLRNTNKEAVAGKNLFGSLEYYLGMLAGVLRYLAIILVFSVFMAAPTYTPAYRASITDFNKKVFGGGLYAGSFFFDLPTIQDYMFKDSKAGPWIHENISWIFLSDTSIKSTKLQPKRQPHIFIQLAPTPVKPVPAPVKPATLPATSATNQAPPKTP